MSASQTPTRREALITYLKSSVDAGDWHAVRDAAVDIEVLEAVDKHDTVPSVPCDPPNYCRKYP